MNKTISLLFLSLLTNQSLANDIQQKCEQNISLLRSDLISILKKIPAMPPLAQIYNPLRRELDEAEVDKQAKLYGACIDRTERAISYSKRYSGR